MSRYVWYKDGKVFKETKDVGGEELIKQYFDDGGYYSYGVFYDSNGGRFKGDTIKKYGDFIGENFNGSLYLDNTKITSLGELKALVGNLHLNKTLITSLGNLKMIGGRLRLDDTPITSLGSLETVLGGLNLKRTPNLTSLGKLKSVSRKIFYDEGTVVEKLLKERGLI